MRKLLSSLLVMFCTPLGAAELPPLGEPAKAWAASLGHGAVATAEKRDGRWTFAIAGQPFAASKVFTGILLADAVAAGKLRLDDTLAARLPVKLDDPATGAP